MQLRTKVVGAADIAALVAAGGFSFTASSSIPGSALGYAEQDVTGAVVTDVHWTPTSGDSTTVDKVMFNTQDDLSGITGASASLDTDATNGDVASCNLTVANTITCTFGSSKPLTDDINEVKLTVRNA